MIIFLQFLKGLIILKKKVVLLFGIVKTAGKLQLNASKSYKYTCTIFQSDILAWSSKMKRTAAF